MGSAQEPRQIRVLVRVNLQGQGFLCNKNPTLQYYEVLRSKCPDGQDMITQPRWTVQVPLSDSGVYMSTGCRDFSSCTEIVNLH